MKFESHSPSEPLRPYINAIVVSENDDEHVYKVLPDTSLVIGFQYRGKLSYIRQEEEVKLASSGLTGLNDSFRIFRNSANVGSILVFFKAGGASAFFKQSVHEFFKESLSLDNFMLRSELLILEEQLYSANTDEQRIKWVERFLISRMREVVPDPIVLHAIALIHKNKGNIRISALMKELCISQSPLEKRFRSAVGTSPKKFSSIVRFKHTIKNYDPNVSLTQLGYESGYYDQAHFIKEFKKLTGELPEVFFGERNG